MHRTVHATHTRPESKRESRLRGGSRACAYTTREPRSGGWRVTRGGDGDNVAGWGIHESKRSGGGDGGERGETRVLVGGGGKGRREWRESGGGRKRSGGERAERELTPLPRHQIASFSPLSPSRGSVSAAAPPLPPLPSRPEEGNVSRVEGGGRSGERGGKGVYNWRRAYARRRAPCEERRRRRRKVEGPVEKREAIAKKKRERDEAAGERGDEEICYPQDSSLHARHRVVRAHTERGFSSTSYLRSFFPAIFPFCLLLFI